MYSIKHITSRAVLSEPASFGFFSKACVSIEKERTEEEKNLMKSLPSSVEMMEADSEVCRQKVKKQQIT